MAKPLNIILTLITVYSYFYCPYEVSDNFMWLQVAIMAITTLLFFREKDHYQIKKDSLRFSVIFVIGFIVVYFQKDVDYLLGLTDMSNRVLWYEPKIVCKCMVISNLALQSFFYGYRLKKGISQKDRIKYKTGFSCKNHTVSNVPRRESQLNVINLCAFVCLLLYVIFVDKAYLFGGYGKTNMGQIADYCLRFAQGFITASIAIGAYRYRQVYKDSNIKLFFKKLKSQVLLSLFFVFLVSLSGSRHLAILMFFLLVFSYTYGSGYRFKIRQIILGIIVAGTLLTLRGITRRETYEGSLSSIEIVSSIIPFTEELAISVMTHHAAVELVPDTYPYNYGLTLVTKPFLIIPGMASLIQNYLGLDVNSANSGGLITMWVLGDDPSFGLGSCNIADIYICFGVIGVIIAFLLWGYLIRYLEYGLYVLNTSSPIFLIVSFVVYSQSLYVCRESFFTILQGIAYPIIFYYLISKKRTKNELKVKDI